MTTSNWTGIKWSSICSCILVVAAATSASVTASCVSPPKFYIDDTPFFEMSWFQKKVEKNENCLFVVRTKNPTNEHYYVIYSYSGPQMQKFFGNGAFFAMRGVLFRSDYPYIYSVFNGGDLNDFIELLGSIQTPLVVVTRNDEKSDGETIIYNKVFFR